MSEWQEIGTAPKEIVRTKHMISGDGRHEYGPRILCWDGEVHVGVWWRVSYDHDTCNWLDVASGNAIRPTKWMPLPAPPVITEGRGEK